jgi:arsenate reductase
MSRIEAMSTVTVYTYANCDSCRKAMKWLRGAGIPVVEKPIRETPPSVAELTAMLAAQGGELRKLFNTSGVDYRALGLSEKLPTMAKAAALTLLAGNGNLVKRPFLLRSDGLGLVGFNEAAWATALKA